MSPIILVSWVVLGILAACVLGVAVMSIVTFLPFFRGKK